MTEDPRSVMIGLAPLYIIATVALALSLLRRDDGRTDRWASHWWRGGAVPRRAIPDGAL